jgi:hypothetical protein
MAGTVEDDGRVSLSAAGADFLGLRHLDCGRHLVRLEEKQTACERCLTTEQARGLAQRWAAVQAAPWDASLDLLMAGTPLTDYEREALLGWVRRRMDAEVTEARALRDGDSFARGWVVAVLEEVLGIHNRHAEVLVDAAGWREVCEAAGWPPDDDNDLAGWLP